MTTKPQPEYVIRLSEAQYYALLPVVGSVRTESPMWATVVQALRRAKTRVVTTKPLALADGTVSRDHLYYSFIRDDQMVTFAIPKVVVAPVAISACKALMPGWRYVDREDATYGVGGSAEDIERWRVRFLRQLDSTCLTRERALSYVDLEENAA